MNTNRAHDREPLLAQVGPALVEHDAERAMVGKCCEYVAKELVRRIHGIALRKYFPVKYRLEVAVRLDNMLGLLLEVSLGELGFDEQVTEMHIDFGAIGPAIGQGNAGFEAEFGLNRILDTKHIQERLRLECPRVAEDVHQQRIRAAAGIQFAPVDSLSGQSLIG